MLLLLAIVLLLLLTLMLLLIQDPSTEGHRRSSEGDLRAVVNGAVALALQQAHSREEAMGDDADAAAASRTRWGCP